ncbi:MAG: phosphatase PAP2 family protein [Actinomycetota bacterium]|nr:phosphatase PAP2 family protein [Actinomycetota bacterium]MEE3073947.1 phosphatase PAP2 family protein [Actinomycetota bacterium]
MGQAIQSLTPKLNKIIVWIQKQNRTTTIFLNLATFGLLWLGYSTVRRITADSTKIAAENAVNLVKFQDWMGFPNEATLQGWFIDSEVLIKIANTFYFVMHFPSMIVFLVWVMVRKIEWMPQVRASLCLATFSGLIIHLLFPLMPPRLMVSYGFIDTAKVFGPDPYSLGIAKAANEFAAMPSLHVGWALLIALAAIRILKTPARWLMLLHPILTTIVVVVTANHFWLDIIVGAILALAGWQLATKYWPIQTIKKMKDQFFMSEEDRKVAEEKLAELKATAKSPSHGGEDKESPL